MRLVDAAAVLRSKNSGPFEITVDVLFSEPAVYYRVKDAGHITRSLLSQLYQIDQGRIKHLVFFDQALGFKFTFAREVSSGTCRDRDVYGAQQHAPLMEWEFDR